ncbi:hypothetical protein [Mesorhizobium sp. B2-1-2]|uniref:DUF7940 domain-containing protein n=1 Tax=Mesorhizobium sp. B2-1-2 TaxID=2589973 RepID=UPI00112DF207|nr:hypothetical protein [Mesorhizobium sp. B2-1-2]TPN04530.1 hypothetical protein FJ971_29750 [Mesorhizobium sp. B2-1-2]
MKRFLVPNTGKVAKYSHSLHLNILGVLCLLLCAAESAWPLLGGYVPISPALFATFAGLFTALAIPARFIIHKQLSGDPDADK